MRAGVDSRAKGNQAGRLHKPGMRAKTQERIEELARARAAATIDLPLVEEGIEIGKKMMAEMIAGYSTPAASPGATTTRDPAAPSTAANGSGYLNEVSARPTSVEPQEA